MWFNRASSGRFSDYLQLLRANARLIQPLARFTRKKTFARMHLGGLWLVIRPAILIGAIAFATSRLLGDGGPSFFLSTLLGLGIWYSFHRLLILLSGTPRRLTRLRSQYAATPRFIFVLAGFGPALVEAGVILSVALAGFLVVSVQAGTPLFAFPRGLGLIPLAFAVMALFASSMALLVSHLVDFAADTWLVFKYAIGAMFLLTPVIYQVEMVPDNLLPLIWLNPFTSAVQGFRAAFLPAVEAPWFTLLGALTAGILALLASLYISYRLDRQRHGYMPADAGASLR